ncbi:hypothetical protein IFM47457_07169 [Aspergillus lentulus]|uniref:Uncharacterized protein n=1 Tax=Aspergillus lentulus TaxID=293939 RepID=A0ABQ1AJQ0_ASPLE|nr:hypothetical protein IFM60648_06599 [Aspergillus lentulus]GFF86479.1 hypothetical protein IFM47457_07169 [Aspergillus lentulus]
MAAAAATLALAQTNITADVCADPSTFTSCTTKALADAYSCEYGKLVAMYFVECPTASEPIPIWPAPDNAPGGCSCNLGKVLQATLNAQKERNACLTNKTTTNVIELSKKYTACGCCEVSTRLSGYVATRLVRTIVTDKKGQDVRDLPDTISADMGADLWLRVSTIYGAVVHWILCGSVMDAYDCGKLGFAPPSSKLEHVLQAGQPAPERYANAG